MLLVGMLALALSAPAADLPGDASTFQVEREGLTFSVAVDEPLARPPRGTVVLLHGFPGSPLGQDGWREQRLLVASLVSDGYAVVRFDYIGSWKSPGRFTWIGGVQDAQAVLSYLRSDEAGRLRIESSRIALVGHSYGGWVGLMVAAREPDIPCVAAMASANLGRTGQLIRDDLAAYERRVALYQAELSGSDPPIRAESGEALANELVGHAEEFDLARYIGELRAKKLFLVSAENDQIVPQRTFLQPFMDRLLEAGTSLRAVTMNGATHNFPEHGRQVNEMLYEWIKTGCGL